MPKDFNQSTSLESYSKLKWVYSNTSIIIIRTLYVSKLNTDCVQLFDSLFHTLLAQITIQFVRLVASSTFWGK